MRSSRILAFITAGAALAACKDSTPPAGLGPPAKIDVVSGNNQSTPANTSINAPITVVVKDANGQVLPDKTVTMTVVAGGGSIPVTTATTDAVGQVTLPSWTLGKSAGPQRVRFMADTAHFDAAASVQTQYNIIVRFWGQAMTTDQQALFTSAAQRIEGIVTGDVQDALAQNIDLNSACGVSGQPTMNETIDDIIIYASIQPIDGSGKILAQSGPCLIRDDPDGIDPPFPAVGIMEFDSADLTTLTAGGSLQDVITHEMMHVLGFGSLWNYGANPLVVGDQYRGPEAVAAYDAVTEGTQTFVPVETDGGSGTAGSHWDETALGAELMTGYINSTGNYLSKFSVMSLADLGYKVTNFDYPHDSVTIA